MTVKIMEVGPRDGLQNEATLVDTSNKIALIEGLVKAGLRRIEITAFVSPKWIPPLADQLEVARGVKRVDGVSYAALVPNMVGYERAKMAGVSEVSLVIAASDTHNRKNINASTSEAAARYAEVAERCVAEKMPFRTYISCAFGCPYEGEIAVSKVIELSKQFLALGAYEISVSDTIGVGHPLQTKKIVAALLTEIPADKIALHFHDTRGMALANIFAALDLGIRSFDSSLGGLGGCPYAPGASGNVATEDLLYMLHKMGFATGINESALCEISLQMERWLGRRLPAKVLSVCRAQKLGGASV